MTSLRVLRHSLYVFSIALSLFSFSVFANTNVALNKTATASTYVGADNTAKQVLDGKLTTRWASSYADNNWIAIDLGASHTITGVKLQWEGAYGKSYQIQTSADGSNWKTVFSTTTGDGGADNITLAGVGRYVRMKGVQRGTQWGYSLWEFAVYGTIAATTSNLSSTTATNIARGKTVTASTSIETSPGSVVDGSLATRWASSHADSNWIAIDLGATHTITGVKLQWEGAYGKSYQIQTSNDKASWTTIYSTTTGDGGSDSLTISGSGRYLRMLGVQRATIWGYSLWEFEVYGAPGNITATNVARNKPVTAMSSKETSAASVVDGSLTTRWASSYEDKNWIAIDLGSLHTITAVKLVWEGAYGKSYQIQTSNDNANWTTIYSTTTGDGGSDNLVVAGSGRYVRMLGIQRATVWGYSLWEFEVHGFAGGGTGTSSSSRSSSSTGATISSSAKSLSSSSRSSAVSSVASSRSSQSSSSGNTGGLALEWYLPTARTNGSYLELYEIGAYEIRYKKSTDLKYTIVVIRDTSADYYTLPSLSGTYEFKIATIDTNGNYSDFVTLVPR